MNVLSLLSVRNEILSSRTNVSACDFGELSLDIKSEASKLFNVYRSSSLDVLTNILNKCLPDNNHLCFGLERFQVCCSSSGGVVMLSRVLIAVL